MSCKPRQLNKFVSLLGVTLGGAASFGAICLHRGDETFYSKLLMPMITKYVDPELAHEACIFFTKHKLIKCQDTLNKEQAERLKIKVFNMSFLNPVGVSAGFDKNCHAAPGLANYGLAFVEVGTVTPLSQDGNQKPRIFRILGERALINRCGFNNKGIDHVRDNLLKQEPLQPMLLGLNLGKNKSTTHISSDYLIGLEKAHDLKAVDYIVINISSPNTPGLRDTQNKNNLELLLDDVLSKMNKLSINKPLLIKIAPDLTDKELRDIAEVVTNKRCGDKCVDGVILTNTTISRPSSGKPSNDIYNENGGLSGPPLSDMSTKMIDEFYRLTGGKIPIIGVGGISSGRDAYDKIKAGASLVQLYTSLTYEGPPIVNRIKRELAELLENDGLASVADAVGLNHRTPANK